MEPSSNNVFVIAETLNSLATPASKERDSATPPPPSKRRRFLAFVILLLVLAAGSAVAWVNFPPSLGPWMDVLPWIAEAPEAKRENTTNAKVAESAESVPPVPDAAEVTASGYVVAPTTSTLYTPRTDRIIAVHVKVGDRVSTNQPLVELDGTSAHFALERARMTKAVSELDVRALIIDLAQSEANYERDRELAKKRALAQNRAEDARFAREKALVLLDRAKQQLAQSEVDLRIAQDAVDELIVRAPFAGIVAELSARVGTTVFEPGSSLDPGDSRLMTITDAGDMVIDADFAERNIAIFQKPIIAEAVLDAFPDRPFAIELERIATVASSLKGTITIRFRIPDPPAGTRPNMAVRIRVTEAEPAVASRSK